MARRVSLTKNKGLEFSFKTYFLWEQRESNPRPSACKADALNQLSYAPDAYLLMNLPVLFEWECKDRQNF